MSRLFIIAGQPGAGKSTFALELQSQVNNCKYIAQDFVKEFLYDNIGFENLELKEQLIDLSRSIFYTCCEYCFKHDVDLIIDYPFSDVQKQTLLSFVNTYNLDVRTFVLYGDCQQLYKRVVKREGDGRHPGHQAQKYPQTKQEDYKLQSYEQYQQKCRERNYPQFDFINTVRIDSTKTKISEYSQIISEYIS